MQQYYTLKVAGLTRQLPLCAVSDKLDIAAFIMFSDVELTVACAKDLEDRSPLRRSHHRRIQGHPSGL